MRKNILYSGFALLILALVFGAPNAIGLLFGLPISGLNIILGGVTRQSRGFEVQPESGEIKLLVDRGVVGASIYQFVFTNSKLVMKRLASIMVTVLLALILAVLGLEFFAIIGAVMGGITGYSLQEFLTQRVRNKIESGNTLTSTGGKDTEIDYADLVDVRLVKSRLYLTTESRTIVASFPRKHSQKMRPVLSNIFRSKFVAE